MQAHPAIARLFASSPLRHGAFRLFYVGAVSTALGYTMQATVAAWLMATLTPSALMVALVQTASTAPALLLGLAAGTLADIVDRKLVIFTTQVLLFSVAALLGIAELLNWVGPAGLLAMTFLIGAGFTVYLPAQQASVNGFVQREELPRAVALGAVAMNVARAIGPALAGAIVAAAGSGVAMLISAGAFTVMLFALRRWKNRELALPGVPEKLLSGVMSGIRFARHSPAMRSLILRNLSFSVCASAMYALLAVIARDQLGLGATGYGILFAGFGTGAVVGALSIPRELQRRPLNSIVTSAVILWTAATVLMAVTQSTPLAVLATFCAGTAWVGVLASLSAGTQSTAPAWVRARAVAMYLVATQASLAFGAALWGALASATGTRVTLAASAAAMIVLHLANRRISVAMGRDADVSHVVQPDMSLAFEPSPDDGPVLIQIEYQIAAEDCDAFLRAAHAAQRTRRRNGATSWRLFRDVEQPGRYVERFIIASWAEYVRLRQRMTLADRELTERMDALQRPGVPVRISRLIGIE
jgi:MFS family permease